MSFLTKLSAVFVAGYMVRSMVRIRGDTAEGHVADRHILLRRVRACRLD
ncbi:hypothetical protein MOV08_42440 [Streptomyces yunnanensis]|uniref:Uncharacterized protein n=1 Tax=Streptomyces yunnanensis TaxID=156453 RepID=A0ABY8AMD1_9ACTN|nr:hypothetical protein [Streptomyces yunnanensis]WEB45306.1 hypothetical protein MOV08_42440 [Streptomyces yunnanensis]